MLKILFAALAAALSAAPAAAADEPPPPIPAEAFAALPFMEDPALSPDGRRVAARVYRDGREQLGAFTIDSANRSAPAIIDVGEEVDIRGFDWAGNDRLVIRLGLVQRYMGIEFRVTRLVVFEIDAQRIVAVRAGNGIVGDDVVFIDPAGAWFLVSSQEDPFSYPDVYRVDTATGRSERVERGRTGVWDWFADASGVIRAGVDYGERRLRIYYREAAGANLRLVENRRVPRDDSVIESIRFIEDTSRGVVVSNAETGRFAVYEYDFATDTRGATLFEHPEVDAGYVIVGDDGRIVGVTYEDDRPRVRWLDPALDRMQRAIDRALPGKHNVIESRSADGSRVLIWSGGADDPGLYYIYTIAARRMDPIAAPHEPLMDRALAPVRPISYRSRDGLVINGYLTLPPGRPEQGLPLIVMPHGGPFARDSWVFNARVQFLANRGYAVLQPNFRGSTGYGREFVERGYGQWGAGMIDDIDDGVEWLAGQGVIDRSRVCLMGSSYGGYAALWGAIRGAGRYRCAISFAGVTDIRALLRYDARAGTPARYRRDWRRMVEGEERQDLAAISPLQQAARLNIPVLIAHGERDRTVPVAQSRNLVRALSRAGARQVEAVFYPEAGHGFSRPEDSLDFLRRVEAFLARHNPARTPAEPAATPPAAGGVSISPSSG